MYIRQRWGIPIAQWLECVEYKPPGNKLESDSYQCFGLNDPYVPGVIRAVANNLIGETMMNGLCMQQTLREAEGTGKVSSLVWQSII